MTNLTSFVLCRMSPGDLTIKQLLDFLESTPRLGDIKLDSATPVTGGQDGRLVSLDCLKWMSILWGEPSSLLLDHLLIPVGARLTRWVTSFDHIVEVHLPKSLDNLRNITDFTKIVLHIGKWYTHMRLSGPNGQLCLASQAGTPYKALESLAQFDTSKIEWLKIVSRNRRLSDSATKALLPLKNLRTLTLYRCTDPYDFICALYLDETSSEVVTCPNLEVLVLVLRTNAEKFDITNLIRTVAARASRGVKLKTIRIDGGKDKLRNPEDVLELRKHVLHVEYRPEVNVIDSDNDVSAEERIQMVGGFALVLNVNLNFLRSVRITDSQGDVPLGRFHMINFLG